MTDPGNENHSSQQSSPDATALSFPVVGIGASAGGLEVLEKLFDQLPREPGMAFVLVQHLAPDHESMSAELISRHTEMPVEQLAGSTPIEADHVYVIPPGGDLSVSGGVLQVEERARESGQRSTIDAFFRSLAGDQGENAICIVLSGSGSDGALGLKEVKARGGMTLAQEPRTATFDSMPNSAISTGRVDRVLAIAEMAGLLQEYAGNLAALREKGTDGIFEDPDEYLKRICEILVDRTGRDFRTYKKSTLLRRIQRRLQVHHDESAGEYIERLGEDPEEAEQLQRDLLIGVTEFFRNTEAFDALADRVIPRIFKEKDRDDSVRIWVPGCATGEEAYSIAMLVAEHMKGLDSRPEVKIFATDIDERALRFGRNGVYPEGIVDHVSKERLGRYFEKRQGGYQIAKRIRSLCIFSPHDLLRDTPFSRLDLISCRNLLIYLEAAAQEKIVPLFHYALRSGGYLFLGPSENIPRQVGLFKRVDQKHRIFRRTGAVAEPPVEFPLMAPHDRKHRALPVDLPRRPARETENELVRRLKDALIESHVPPAVIINRGREMVYVFGRTGRFLEASTGVPSDRILERVRPGLRLELRSAIYRAEKNGERIERKNVRVQTNDHEAWVHLTVEPMGGLAEDDPDLYLVCFRESTPPETEEEKVAPGDGADWRVVAELEEELSEAREHLEAAIEELEGSNEELQSSNEELLSMNEELQSANEELQTSKEETQSVNEELATVNAELNHKVDELDAAHSDLQNLFQSTEIATVFLDADLRIRRFTPAATEVFRLIEDDVGRSIGDITRRFENGGIVELAEEVLETLSTAERQVHVPEDGTWYNLRIRPYRTVENVIDGIVLTLADITEVKRAEEREEEARRYAEGIVNTVHEPLVVLDRELRVESASRSFYERYRLSPGEAEGESLFALGSRWKVSDLRSTLEETVRRAAAAEEVEIDMEVPGRGTRRLRLDARPLLRDGQETSRILLALQDVTELRELLEARERDSRRKDDFLAMLGHELRGPLSPLKSSLDVLNLSDAGDPRLETARAIMGRQVDNLSRLVDDLLNVSRVSRGEFSLETESLNLVEVVRETLEDFRVDLEKRGLTVAAETPDEPVWISGDRTRLAQVLDNLLENARKFSEEGGRITVRLRREESDSEGGDAVLAVEDTGVGMNEETLEMLFEPFTQFRDDRDRSEQSLGLGLALVRNIVELHGGVVRAESPGRGQGSTFTVRLPLADEAGRAELEEKARRRSAPAPAPARRVLVIEDNADAAESLRLLLESRGHEVSVAGDGSSGIEKARELRPDIVLCDIGLPGDVDGYEVGRTIRDDPELSRVCVIAVTGFGRREDRKQALEDGFDDHVTKPIGVTELDRLAAVLPERCAPEG